MINKCCLIGDSPSSARFDLLASKTDHTVAVAHGRHLGIGDDNRLIGVVERGLGAAFDAGGAIADDIVKIALELANHLGHAGLVQGILVPWFATSAGHRGHRPACP